MWVIWLFWGRIEWQLSDRRWNMISSLNMHLILANLVHTGRVELVCSRLLERVKCKSSTSSTKDNPVCSLLVLTMLQRCSVSSAVYSKRLVATDRFIRGGQLFLQRTTKQNLSTLNAWLEIFSSISANIYTRAWHSKSRWPIHVVFSCHSPLPRPSPDGLTFWCQLGGVA